MARSTFFSLLAEESAEAPLPALFARALRGQDDKNTAATESYTLPARMHAFLANQRKQDLMAAHVLLPLIELLRSSRTDERGLASHFLCKFEGHPIEEASWEPAEQIQQVAPRQKASACKASAPLCGRVKMTK